MLVYFHSSEIAFILLGTGPLYVHRSHINTLLYVHRSHINTLLYVHRSHINTDYWGRGGGGGRGGECGEEGGGGGRVPPLEQSLLKRWGPHQREATCVLCNLLFQQNQ